VALDRGQAGHVGDGPVGKFARQAEHRRAKRGEEDRGRRASAHPAGETGGVSGEGLTMECDLAVAEQRPQGVEVLAHVAGGAVEVDTVALLDWPPVGRPRPRTRRPPLAAWTVWA
jgi:hypothetical protein